MSTKDPPSFFELGRRLLVWKMATEIAPYDPQVWRRDEYGRVIRWSDYGDRKSEHGWEIDHRHPKALGGSDDASNLRPLHCQVNASLGGLLGGMLPPTPPRGMAAGLGAPFDLPEPPASPSALFGGMAAGLGGTLGNPTGQKPTAARDAVIRALIGDRK